MHQHQGYALLISGLLLAVLLLPAQAQSNERCFEETGYCIAGRIRDYWEQNGGLPVFGLPISEQRAFAIEGQSIEAQWFERNRLELHPENEPPYDVLLGRLGVDVLNQQGRDWQRFPTTAVPEAGCRFFAESGQQVCGEILQFWQANGLDLDQDGQRGENEQESLALFGLPISPAQNERLGDGQDGQEYTVQWFERARFEIHPENPPEFRVLLGLLGNEIHSAPDDAAPPAPTPASAPPDATPTPPAPTAAPAEATATPQREEESICFFPAVPADAPQTPVQIVNIDKVDEVVTLRNVGAEVIDLTGWTVCSVRGNEVHPGIFGLLEPGETARFPNTGEERVWSNRDPDDGVLYDSNQKYISYWDDPADE